MDFIEGLSFYFTEACDATLFLTIGFFSLAVLALSIPKKLNRKDVLILVLRFLIYFISFLLIGALFFGMDRLARTNGVLFNISFLVTPFVAIFFFLKDDFWHRFVKFSLLASTFMVALDISKNLGLIIGKAKQDNTAWVVFGRSLPIFFCLPVSYLMHRFNISRYQSLSKPLLWIIGVVSYSLIGITIFEAYMVSAQNDTIPYLTVMCCFHLVLLVILCLTYYCFYYFVRTRHQALLNDLQVSLGKAHIDQLQLDMGNREELAKIRHDLKNHLSYVHILLDEGKTEEAKEFIEELTAKHDEVLNSFSCSNSVIGAIINMESSKARRMGIAFQPHAVVPPNLPIDKTDLCSLITNLLDNAFLYQDGRMPVKIDIYTYKDYLRITAINSIPEGTEKTAAALKTSKSPKRHGYGTKIVKSIAVAYDGYARFNTKAGGGGICRRCYPDAQGEEPCLTFACATMTPWLSALPRRA